MIYLLFLDDLSKGQYTEQSKTRPCVPTSDCAANNAVDRNVGSCVRTEAFGINSQDKTMWWFVNLGNIYSIYSVRILFKDYGPEYGTVIHSIVSFFWYLNLLTHFRSWAMYITGNGNYRIIPPQNAINRLDLYLWKCFIWDSCTMFDNDFKELLFHLSG